MSAAPDLSCADVPEQLMLMWDDAGDSDVPQAVSLLGLALQFDDEHLVRGTLEAMAALVERRGHQVRIHTHSSNRVVRGLVQCGSQLR